MGILGGNLMSIILQFGKKGDLVSSLNIFEASNKDMDSPNMYIYFIIIDVCGLCTYFLRSRSIYADLRTQMITPNLYVFNSLMNVNAHDLRLHVADLQTYAITTIFKDRYL